MDDKYLEYLFVSGELNKDDSLSDDTISNLYAEYNAMFPGNPLDNDFFFMSQEDQISLLVEAINSGEPIIKKGK